MKFRGAIFDMDGTLLDSMPVWMESGAMWLRSLGIEPEKNLGEKLFTMTMMECAVYLKETYHQSQREEEIIAAINALMREQYRFYIPLKPGVKNMLEWLKGEEIPMAVATATDRPLVEDAFRRLGILPFFTEIFTCSEVGVGKEFPLIYEKAADAIGTKPEETLVFEDALYALITAKKAGFYTVGLYDEVSKEKQKELRRQAHIYGRGMEDILTWLKG